MRQPRKKTRTAILVGIGIVGLSALLAAWTCGKGVGDYYHWMASSATPRASPQYSSSWPVSESDFAAAQDLVSEELHFFERIANVNVPGPNEIRISAAESNSTSHRVFFLKRVRGEWKIVERLALSE